MIFLYEIFFRWIILFLVINKIFVYYHPQNDCSNIYRGGFMRSKNVLRDYKMTDSELCLLTPKICMFLTRDLADLQDFRID